MSIEQIEKSIEYWLNYTSSSDEETQQVYDILENLKKEKRKIIDSDLWTSKVEELENERNENRFDPDINSLKGW